MTNDDRPPTPDERRAMDWWNALSDQQRGDLLKKADTRVINPSAAEAWNLLIAGEIDGPPLPANAKPLNIPSPSPRRRNAEPPRLRLVSTVSTAIPSDDAPTEDDVNATTRAAEAYLARAHAFADRQRERWGAGEQRMTRLARRFPSLADADGIEPWDAMRFLRWACTADLTSGRLHAVRFVLQVWNPSTNWIKTAAAHDLDGGHLLPFNVIEACGVWDETHRAACLAWIELPFYP